MDKFFEDSAFMWYLIQMYGKYRKEGLGEPEPREKETEWRAVIVDNVPPLIPIEAFDAMHLYKWMLAGELEWKNIPKTKQLELIDAKIVDESGNSLPRIRLIPFESKFIE